MLYGEKAFEISDNQEGESWLNRQSECNNVTLGWKLDGWSFQKAQAKQTPMILSVSLDEPRRPNRKLWQRHFEQTT